MEDLARKREINNAIVDALIQFMPHSVAKEVVKAIAKSKVPFLAVRYDG